MMGSFETWDDMEYERGRADGYNDYFGCGQYRGDDSRNGPYESGYYHGWYDAEDDEAMDLYETGY